MSARPWEDPWWQAAAGDRARVMWAAGAMRMLTGAQLRAIRSIAQGRRGNALSARALARRGFVIWTETLGYTLTESGQAIAEALKR